VMLKARLTGTQTYLLPGGEKKLSSAKAIGRSALPPRYRSLMAFPINLMAQDKNAVDHLTASFSNWSKMFPPGVSLPPGLFDTFVLDSGNLQQPGGTGKSFDWEAAAPIAEGMRQGRVKLVVAGGLTPENICEAMGILHPWGVDVASGVEARPGKKDPEKVRAFVRAVREMDRKAG
jgi:hypothetical protein